MADIYLAHFLWMNIQESALIRNECNFKVIAFNYPTEPIIRLEPPDINLPLTRYPGNVQ